ncbi:mitochondrial 37S ribosomal protein MRP4 PAS_c131_0005 [Komagataella phaffii GS115]|uniref:37S ribosomal protein, mitochondrial n=2 Tax=Komagataella phaffii TaxID=460519 RepID=C4R383_KOMPG|nr:mitochondrial 37S ribosomal protein MRP4 PAS_c131_0005 [Komagataella phaffii GS115]AOA64071.1 GQ67_04287T0 [Komagataella phaffii]AOA68315.1 GQ68_04259T0 [Komagataella phaffii GS115]CAY71217.1 Hypothetical protein PAS_c131_0005 [Komagataella phaffii GS115]
MSNMSLVRRIGVLRSFAFKRPYSISSDIDKSHSYKDIDQRLKYDEIRGKIRALGSLSEEQANDLLTEYNLDQKDHVDFRNMLKDFLDEFLNKEEIKLNVGSSNIGTNVRNSNKFPFLNSTPPNKEYSIQELFVRQYHHSQQVNSLGASLTNVYKPHEDVLNPKKANELSIKTLLAAGVHLGHSTSLYRPSTQPFIYGEYKGLHIIDLEQTLIYLKRASKVVQGVAEKGGLILFLGTRDGQRRSLEEAASRVKGYFVSSRWIPGTLTNCTEISGTWQRHEVDLEDTPTGRNLEGDELSSLVKPDLIVILNPVENRNALKEAMYARVPTIGIVDTDSEPSLVTYPVPGNDDSNRSTDLILGVLSKAGELGRRRRLEKVQQYRQLM